MLLFYKEHQKIYDEMEKFMKDGKEDDPVRSDLPVFKKYKNPLKA